MDMKSLRMRLGLAEDVTVVRKAQELLRLSNVHFNASSFGVGEVCKSVLCFELACSVLQVSFNRQKGIRVSGLSEKAYVRSLAAMQNALGLRLKVDIRELAIQFGCVRLINIVHKALETYKQRFVAALPVSRRSSADFSRSVFTAVAFYLSAKKHKLKVDKMKLMEICGTSDTEFGNVATSMLDLCFDILGVEKEKRDPKSIQQNRELLDVIPGKRRHDTVTSDSDSESVDDEDGLEVPDIKRSRVAINSRAYSQWKASIMTARQTSKTTAVPDGYRKPTKQLTLSFLERDSHSTIPCKLPKDCVDALSIQ
ncbi:hypothetical protein BDL97_16G089100 [Sphagnum fallax]|nr:hypothetical protein BDL97_16G089100 [Sphagnum fallax]